MRLSKYEQETIINFNAGEKMASLYTRDKDVMEKMDSMVEKYPEIYQLTKETEIDKTYRFPKSYLNCRKPRQVTNEVRDSRRDRMITFNTKG